MHNDKATAPLFPDLQADKISPYFPEPSSFLYITKLTIKRFKRIKEADIILCPFTVLTGVNNSGKSAIMQAIWVAFECLRICTDRHTYKIVPSKVLKIFEAEFLPVNEYRDLWYSRRYRKGNQYLPVSIRVELSNGFFFKAHLILAFGGINVRIVDWNEDAGPAAVAEALKLAPIYIPGHAEIAAHEEYRVSSQIYKLALSGALSSIIRNVLLRLKDAKVSDTDSSPKYTAGFVVDTINRHFDARLEHISFDPDHDLELRVPYKEEDWELDIVSAGSGFHQILKLATFIAWRKARIVLLDEPDAHLHTSLQARLASFLQELATGLQMQIILATHSRDLISQAPIESVVPVDYKAPTMRPISSMAHLLAEYRRLGTIKTVDVALLYQTKRCLFVEGPSDVELLPLIAERIGMSIFTGPTQFVTFDFKGVEKFTMVKDLADLFERVIGSSITWFVVRDRDSATPRILEHIKSQAEAKGITKFHVWERYSLENYLLDIPIFTVAVQMAARARGIREPREEEIRGLLADACGKVLLDVRAQFLTTAQTYFIRHQLEQQLEIARDRGAEDALAYLELAQDLDAQLRILPGSKIFGQSVQDLQDRFGITLDLQDLIRHLNSANAPEELKTLFERLTKL